MGRLDVVWRVCGAHLLCVGGWWSAGCAPREASVSERPAVPASAVPVAATRSTRVPAGVRVDNGKPFRRSDLAGTRGVCVFFVGTDCPISNAYSPEMGRIIDEFQPQGIAFYAIYSIRRLPVEQAADHAQAFGLRCTIVVDSQLELAQALGAARMPEAVLLSPEGVAVYQGRIDDRYPAPGAKRREHPTTRDLRDAITAFLAGKPIARPRTPAVGCPLDLPQ